MCCIITYYIIPKTNCLKPVALENSYKTLPCGQVEPLCSSCEMNEGFTENLPCGQQNCWYGCTVCRYNNMQTCDDLVIDLTQIVLKGVEI